MDSFAPLVAYAAALAIAAVIPGPGVAALVGQALGRGLRPSLFFLGGIALGEVVGAALTAGRRPGGGGGGCRHVQRFV